MRFLRDAIRATIGRFNWLVGMLVTLEGRVVIVTGAAQGIGQAVAVRAVEAGAAGVLLTDRSPIDPGQVSQPGSATPVAFVQADLEQDDAPDRIADACLAQFGRIDGLVNAAGITTRGSLASAEPALFDRLMQVNTKAPAFLMQRAIASMRERGGGAIVNVLSINVHGGAPNLAFYAASKAALALLTKNAAQAHRFDRIRVNGVNVGWADTPGERATQAGLGREEAYMAQRAAEQPFGRLLTPDDVARLVLFLLSDTSSPMTGALIDQEQSVIGARD